MSSAASASCSPTATGWPPLTCAFRIERAFGGVTRVRGCVEQWRVTVLDTGNDTMTGGRLKRARDVIGRERCLLTYGDGLADLDLPKAGAAHAASGNWVTLTAVTQPGRYGALRLSPDMTKVQAFREKAAGDGGLINGGFFICEPDDWKSVV